MTALARSLLSLWLLVPNSQAAQAQSMPSSEDSPAPAAEAAAIRTAIQAMTRGQTAVTLAVATTPTDTLQDRINRIHLRMNLLGWKLVGQEYVASSSENSLLLLSYQR
jgi:hypothetical protein